MRRIGFEATAKINRHDLGVSWQDELPGGGVVVSNEFELTLDVEAILLEDLERRRDRVLPKPRSEMRNTASAPGDELAD